MMPDIDIKTNRSLEESVVGYLKDVKKYDSNEISFEVKLLLPWKENKTKFACILFSQFQITNGKNVQKRRKWTQVILRGMPTTRIWGSC